MKKFALGILLFLSALLCVIAAGCEKTTTPTLNQLSAPTNFRIVNNKLIWDSVKNASSYSVSFYGTKNETTHAYLDLPYILSSKAVTFEVCALGDGEAFTDSEQVSFSSRMDSSKITKGLTYTLNDEGTGYSVSGQNANLYGAVIIPDYYEELPIKEIEPCAFVKFAGGDIVIGGLHVSTQTTITSNTDLTSVYLPATLEIIFGNAFAQCVELTEVTIPEGVTIIAVSAFQNCRKLKTVHFPDSLESIAMLAFSGCTSLKSVKIPEGCKVGTGAFDQTVQIN